MSTVDELTPYLTTITPSDVVYVLDEGSTDKGIEGRNLLVTRSITESTHTLNLRDAVAHNGSNWVQADANNSLPCLGLCIEDTDANTFVLAVAGIHEIGTHGWTIGTQYYLSETAGGVTTTAPGPGSIVQAVLVPITSTAVIVNIGEAKT